MDLPEIVQSVKDALRRLWERTAFVVRSYRKTFIVAALVLSVGLVFWARAGFTLQFSKFFANEGDGGSCQFQTCFGNTAWDPVSCHCKEIGGTNPSTSATPTNQKVSPHSYCDYATNSCKTAASEDWNAPQCAGSGSCAPGNCRVWTGSGTTWSPSAGPDGVPACEPLSQIPGTTITGYVGGVLNPGRTGFPQCFIANTYSSQDPNFGTFAGITGDSVAVVLKDRPNAKLFYKAFVVNNCPWPVHMVLQTDGSAKSSTDIGAGKRDKALVDDGSFVTFKMPNGFNIPSCWNSGGAMPKDCAREVEVNFNLNAFTCGSVGLQIEWVHLTSPGGGTAGGIKDPQGAGTATSLNYGRDCTGSQVERAPGAGTGGTGTGGASCTATPAAPVLSVQCGATQNVLTWTNPVNACVMSVLRGVDGGNAAFVGGTLPLTTTTYTDTSVQSGHSYTYRIKNHPSVSSNAVTCNNGAQVTTAPTNPPAFTTAPPGSTVPPPTFVPGETVTALPTATNVVVLTPTPVTSGDLDGDGVPNSVECPTYTGPESLASCSDFDGDGTPDILDTDSDNDGIADGRDCNRLGPNTSCVGGVQTGPGDATLLALIVSAAVSLAYVSYTHSGAGLRKEVEVIAGDQGPMDFRT